MRRLYHTSCADQEIGEFQPLTHFGTAKAAFDRARSARMSRGAAPTVYVVDVELKKPMRVRDMKQADHSPVKMADMLYYTAKKITDEERTRIFNAQSENAEAAIAEICRIVSAYGNDGMAYKNKHEDAGRDSFIILSPDQVGIRQVLSFEEFCEQEGFEPPTSAPSV